MALRPGNLLPENMQSFLTSIDGWTVTGADAVFNAIATIVHESLDPPGVMVCTATGTDPTVVTTTDSYPVTEGEEYVAYGWYAGTDRDSTVTSVIVWLDDNGDEIGTTSTTWTSGLSMADNWRASTYGVAPLNSVAARVRFVAGNDAAGDLTVFDLMYLGQPVPGNALDFKGYSSEFELAEWTISGATLSHGILPPLGLGDGRRAAQITPDGPGLISLSLDQPVSAGPGQTFGVRALGIARADSDPAANLIFRPTVTFYDADDSPLPIGPQSPFGEYSSPYDYFTLTSSRTATAPAGTVSVRAGVEILHESGNATQYYFVDSVILLETAPAYVLTVHDALGYVSLEIPMSDSGDDFEEFSVYRVDADGTEHPVRGYGSDMERIPWTPGQLLIEDYEAPVGTRVHYTVRYYANAGDERPDSWLNTYSVTAPTISDGSYVWIKNPGQPAMNTLVMMAEALSWSMMARSVAIPIVGRSTPVVISQVRGSREGTIQIRIETPQQNDAFRALLEMGQPVLLQAAPGHGVTGNLYLAVGDASYVPDSWNATVPGWLWTLDVTEIDRPIGGIQGSAGRTWADVETDHGTWGDVHTDYSAWSEVLTGG